MDKECCAGQRVIMHIWDTKGTFNADLENNVRVSSGFIVLDLIAGLFILYFSTEGTGPFKMFKKSIYLNKALL